MELKQVEQDDLLQFLWRGLRAESSNHLTVPVDEELGKVPGDIRVAFFVGTFAFQHIVEFARLRAVDVYLAEDRKVRLIFAVRKFQYLGIATRFLGAKLIAGKGHHGEWMIAEFFL